MLEGYTTLGYLAGKTDRMTLGLLVTGVMYRYRAPCLVGARGRRGGRGAQDLARACPVVCR
ncbi:hypothetical protein GCM10027569_82210 [Flindersiella endophytica]